jgi:hypothetical protein
MVRLLLICPATALEMIQVNVAAAVHPRRCSCSHEVPARPHRHRRIHRRGIPSQVALTAIQGLLDAFATSLHRELRGRAACECKRPGPVATEFFETSAAWPASGPIPARRFAIRASGGRAVWSVIKGRAGSSMFLASSPSCPGSRLPWAGLWTVSARCICAPAGSAPKRQPCPATPFACGANRR